MLIPVPHTYRSVVIVFATEPVPGQVKIGLTPALGADEAADLSRALLLDTLETVDDAGLAVTVAFAPATAKRPFERLFGGRRTLVPQGPGGRGERWERAFDRVRSAHGVIAVESDCPGLTVTRLHEAAAALESADTVVGSADGGDYLVGLKRPRAGAFTDDQFDLDKFASDGIEVVELPRERRVRTPADVFEWYAGAQEHDLRTTYPRTWAVLHAMLPPPRFSAFESQVFDEPEP